MNIPLLTLEVPRKDHLIAQRLLVYQGISICNNDWIIDQYIRNRPIRGVKRI